MTKILSTDFDLGMDSTSIEQKITVIAQSIMCFPSFFVITMKTSTVMIKLFCLLGCTIWFDLTLFFYLFFIFLTVPSFHNYDTIYV